MKWLMKYFGTLLVVGIVVSAVGLAMTIWYANPRLKNEQIDSFAECAAAGNPIMESFPEQCRANGKTFTNTNSLLAKYSDTVTSGKKAFSVEIPRGWGPIINAADSNMIMLNGDKQPSTDSAKAVEVVTTDAYGHDGPIVFQIGVFEVIDASLPAGTKSDVTIGKGDSAITGAKYSYEYPEDTAEGIGARLKGDRDYMYLFQLKNGSYLRASYHVYGSDPKNLVRTFDEILQTVKVQ